METQELHYHHTINSIATDSTDLQLLSLSTSACTSTQPLTWPAAAFLPESRPTRAATATPPHVPPSCYVPGLSTPSRSLGQPLASGPRTGGIGGDSGGGGDGGSSGLEVEIAIPISQLRPWNPLPPPPQGDGAGPQQPRPKLYALPPMPPRTQGRSAPAAEYLEPVWVGGADGHGPDPPVLHRLSIRVQPPPPPPWPQQQQQQKQQQDDSEWTPGQMLATRKSKQRQQYAQQPWPDQPQSMPRSPNGSGVLVLPHEDNGGGGGGGPDLGPLQPAPAPRLNRLRASAWAPEPAMWALGRSYDVACAEEELRLARHRQKQEQQQQQQQRQQELECQFYLQRERMGDEPDMRRRPPQLQQQQQQPQRRCGGPDRSQAQPGTWLAPEPESPVAAAATRRQHAATGAAEGQPCTWERAGGGAPAAAARRRVGGAAVDRAATPLTAVPRVAEWVAPDAGAVAAAAAAAARAAWLAVMADAGVDPSAAEAAAGAVARAAEAAWGVARWADVVVDNDQGPAADVAVQWVDGKEAPHLLHAEYDRTPPPPPPPQQQSSDGEPGCSGGGGGGYGGGSSDGDAMRCYLKLLPLAQPTAPSPLPPVRLAADAAGRRRRRDPYQPVNEGEWVALDDLGGVLWLEGSAAVDGAADADGNNGSRVATLRCAADAAADAQGFVDDAARQPWDGSREAGQLRPELSPAGEFRHRDSVDKEARWRRRHEPPLEPGTAPDPTSLAPAPGLWHEASRRPCPGQCSREGQGLFVLSKGHGLSLVVLGAASGKRRRPGSGATSGGSGDAGASGERGGAGETGPEGARGGARVSEPGFGGPPVQLSPQRHPPQNLLGQQQQEVQEQAQHMPRGRRQRGAATATAAAAAATHPEAAHSPVGATHDAPGPGPDATPHAARNSSPRQHCGSGAGPDSGTDSGCESLAGDEAGALEDPGTESGWEAGPGPGSELGSGRGLVGPERELGSGWETGPCVGQGGLGSGWEARWEAEPAPGPGPETGVGGTQGKRRRLGGGAGKRGLPTTSPQSAAGAAAGRTGAVPRAAGRGRGRQGLPVGRSPGPRGRGRGPGARKGRS
ncbi:hypothetical protein PLESTM_000862600 [Pleodorina starrii]|nr:hypothetical protein PLESTM_000862600 [Pleodorina starrii]